MGVVITSVLLFLFWACLAVASVIAAWMMWYRVYVLLGLLARESRRRLGDVPYVPPPSAFQVRSVDVSRPPVASSPAWPVVDDSQENS